jgi:pyruvate ferredoxin oxidoreductase alpha subunit
MAECLYYASGGRFPIVMMNADRSTALPWNIYGDQRDSLSQLDSGWIQVYAENAQEALDLALMSWRIAEDRRVSTPVMVNLDGFVLTHTYETVEIPAQQQADRFLPPYVTDNRIDFDNPKNLAFSAGPDTNYIFKYKAHQGMLAAKETVTETEDAFAEIFGRRYSGLLDNYRTEDADFILVTLGSIAGLCRETADKLRQQGIKAGVVRIRYMRPFPNDEIAAALKKAKAFGVLEKDISFGNEGTVYTNVNSALQKAGIPVKGYNFIGGLGGRNISAGDIEQIFADIQSGTNHVNFIGIGGDGNGESNG